MAVPSSWWMCCSQLEVLFGGLRTALPRNVGATNPSAIRSGLSLGAPRRNTIIEFWFVWLSVCVCLSVYLCVGLCDVGS